MEKCGILGQEQKEVEDDIKKAKKRQAMLDNIGVAVATIIMVVMALAIILLKVRNKQISRESESKYCNYQVKKYLN